MQWQRNSLVRQLEQLRTVHPRVGVYRGPADFVLEHGSWYDPRSFPPQVRQAAPQLCFGNSLINSALNRWRYVEGYVLPPGPAGLLLGPVLHGWNADEYGALIDTTWRNTGVAYLGVEFSPERADDASWNGDGCVLLDPNRGYPLFQQRWTGETEATYTLSQHFLLLREGRLDEARAWLQTYLKEAM